MAKKEGKEGEYELVSSSSLGEIGKEINKIKKMELEEKSDVGDHLKMLSDNVEEMTETTRKLESNISDLMTHIIDLVKEIRKTNNFLSEAAEIEEPEGSEEKSKRETRKEPKGKTKEEPRKEASQGKEVSQGKDIKRDLEEEIKRENQKLNKIKKGEASKGEIKNMLQDLVEKNQRLVQSLKSFEEEKTEEEIKNTLKEGIKKSIRRFEK